MAPAPPLSLYVHFPWCERKCPYCDFNSHAVRGTIPERAYVAALLHDLEREAERVEGRPVGSVFLGGGTPSLLSGQGVARLLDGLRACVELAPGCEITMECNPGSAEARRYGAYRAAGVNRLSIGVQTFDDQALARIGRAHDAGQARRAVRWARAEGLESLNVDLMYGLPGQSPNAAIADVREALALEVAHLSHYQLTLEPNTAFHRAPPELPDERAIEAMETGCRALLADAGLVRYEVSAFARAGHRCRHNLNYWRFGDYIGIGAGAHGKLTDPARREVVRSTKKRHPRQYLEAAARGEFLQQQQRSVGGGDLAFEFVLNASRLAEGFAERDFEQATGLAISRLEAGLARGRELGLLERRQGRVRATEDGFRFLNELQALFLPDAQTSRQCEDTGSI